MNLRIKRHDKDSQLPDYQTKGAVAFDLHAREETTIESKSFGYVPLGVSIEVPEGYFVLMAPRSSLHKRGLLLANSIGVFDVDFSGDGDEYAAALYNISDEPVTVKKGERITQGILVKFERAEWEEVESMENETRGGFGSTGS